MKLAIGWTALNLKIAYSSWGNPVVLIVSTRKLGTYMQIYYKATVNKFLVCGKYPMPRI